MFVFNDVDILCEFALAWLMFSVVEIGNRIVPTAGCWVFIALRKARVWFQFHISARPSYFIKKPIPLRFGHLFYVKSSFVSLSSHIQISLAQA